MDLHEEIAKVARELYEKSGRIEGRDQRNWLDAERIVLSRHAGQDMEEPEGEEPLIAEGTLVEEIEGPEAGRVRQERDEEEEAATVIEEVEAGEPFAFPRRGNRLREVAEKIMSAKKCVPGKKATAPKKEKSRKKT